MAIFLQIFQIRLGQQYFFAKLLWVNENVCVQQEEGLVAIFLQIFQTSLLSTIGHLSQQSKTVVKWNNPSDILFHLHTDIISYDHRMQYMITPDQHLYHEQNHQQFQCHCYRHRNYLQISIFILITKIRKYPLLSS